jgi:hypothetical protein
MPSRQHLIELARDSLFTRPICSGDDVTDQQRYNTGDTISEKYELVESLGDGLISSVYSLRSLAGSSLCPTRARRHTP